MWIKSITVAAAIAVASPALGATITLDNLNVGLARTVKTTMTSGTVYAGELRWNVAAMTGNAGDLTGFSVGDSISTFCTQLTQTASSPTVFNVVPVATAPQPGAGMGEIRAGYLSVLYDNYYSQAFDSNTHAAAFQLAIWEIVQEQESSVTSGNLSVTAGAFRATGGSVFQSEAGVGITAVSLANSWLSSILSLATDGSFNLMALTNNGHQDQLTPVTPIPLPAAALLGGLGLLIVPVLKRRLG